MAVSGGQEMPCNGCNVNRNGKSAGLSPSECGLSHGPGPGSSVDAATSVILLVLRIIRTKIGNQQPRSPDLSAEQGVFLS